MQKKDQKNHIHILTYTLYSFPSAAVTKYFKLGCFKQQKLVLSVFWRLEV